MPNLLRTTLPLGVAAGCAAAMLVPGSAPARSTARPATADEEVQNLRAQGPAGLQILLARYERTPAGPERDELARRIDKVAAQRYATESRLYWYTDLEQAEIAAHATHKPILALRMLGALDDELSCANSRLFRSTLYANANVSKFLREHFVLYWSTERPVPKVTIDMGDGRQIVRTVTGNSAHYVLAEDGSVLDVLPGMYTPQIFEAELGKSLVLAKRVQAVAPAQRTAAVIAFHRDGFAKRHATFKSVAGSLYSPTSRTLPTLLGRAQRATVSKAVMEMPILAKIGIDAGSIPRDDFAQWAAVGKYMWKVTLPPDLGEVQPLAFLDEPSRALVARLHTGGAKDREADLGLVMGQLEQHMLADSAQNELQLRQQIRQHIVDSGDLRFTSLNDWVYANVFHTPKQDTWLGLVTPGEFTGLPRDGIVLP
ncbi:MAG TPA: hypothetical protein VFQ53_10680 [Kofleriaceae bacterium]|nr:hypothetical protein [Kofleriaceae bacterium]